ncbi:MAG: hypothetical protein K5843_01050 [Bacteroidales bacterium]|nr:hypothetical protein [Bacteroidales bacterium]
MEYYVLSRYAYWKYYFLILYYRLHEFPPAVRVWAIFTSICLVLLVSIVVGNFIRVLISTADNRAIERYREKFEPHMLEVALTARNLELSEISALMNLPKNFKMRVKQNRRLVPILLGLYRQYADEMNKINWQRLLQVLKMPAYFDDQVRSRSMRKRIIAFKNVADMDANLKEAVASRYLFAKDRKLQNMARLHAARFGTSYPFKVLLEDPNLVFTEELVIKFHNVLLYRMENGMSMPNFIHWCNRTPVNEELRIFAINEIRLFRRKEDCAEMLSMLQNSREERFSCALIQALGELEYVPAEKEFCRRYLSASFTERQELARALGIINSGNPEVLRFLVDDFLQTTDYVTRMLLLRTIYNYGKPGRKTYERLKKDAPAEFAIYFEHIECDLIDSRRYA